MRRGGVIAALARWCFQHRLTVLTLWTIALVGLAVAGGAAKSSYNSSFSVPGSDSAKAVALLQKDFPAQSGDQDTIVWRAARGTVRDPATRRVMTSALARIARLPEVSSVTSPYQPGGAPRVSKDGRTAYALVNFTAQASSLSTADIRSVITAARAASSPALNVEMTGQATDTADQPRLSGTVIVGIAGAAVVLLIAFGSLLAMALPLLTALFGLGCLTRSRKAGPALDRIGGDGPFSLRAGAAPIRGRTGAVTRLRPTQFCPA
jgi:RND superfamily putative drug exporter